ncbi:putative non-specific serine/threonine protein kinase [Arabidopsis thaliana]
MTLRYFPDGKRNCYNLIVKQGTTYMIRATALYGNYDGRNISPKFERLYALIVAIKYSTFS